MSNTISSVPASILSDLWVMALFEQAGVVRPSSTSAEAANAIRIFRDTPTVFLAQVQQGARRPLIERLNRFYDGLEHVLEKDRGHSISDYLAHSHRNIDDKMIAGVSHYIGHVASQIEIDSILSVLMEEMVEKSEISPRNPDDFIKWTFTALRTLHDMPPSYERVDLLKTISQNYNYHPINELALFEKQNLTRFSPNSGVSEIVIAGGLLAQVIFQIEADAALLEGMKQGSWTETFLINHVSQTMPSAQFDLEARVKVASCLRVFDDEARAVHLLKDALNQAARLIPDLKERSEILNKLIESGHHLFFEELLSATLDATREMPPSYDRIVQLEWILGTHHIHIGYISDEINDLAISEARALTDPEEKIRALGMLAHSTFDATNIDLLDEVIPLIKSLSDPKRKVALILEIVEKYVEMYVEDLEDTLRWSVKDEDSSDDTEIPDVALADRNLVLLETAAEVAQGITDHKFQSLALVKIDSHRTSINNLKQYIRFYIQGPEEIQ